LGITRSQITFAVSAYNSLVLNFFGTKGTFFHILFNYFIKRIEEIIIKIKNIKEHPVARPIFLWRPCLVNGIPIDLEIFPFAAEMPNALL